MRFIRNSSLDVAGKADRNELPAARGKLADAEAEL
jgi:hypothetical protein